MEFLLPNRHTNVDLFLPTFGKSWLVDGINLLDVLGVAVCVGWGKLKALELASQT